MSDQLNYDPFEVGDKVWSEFCGFGKVAEKNYRAVMLDFLFSEQWVLPNGRGIHYENRPRTIFHAVDDTDEGMREAIKRGEGLRRPVPRGRWPIEVGDRVLHLMAGVIRKCTLNEEDEDFTLRVPNFGTFTPQGVYVNDHDLPIIIRLYDGEEPPATAVERLRFFASEMEKDGWEEKHGGTE